MKPQSGGSIELFKTVPSDTVILVGNWTIRQPFRVFILAFLTTVLGIRIRNRIQRVRMFLGLPDPELDPLVMILPFSYKDVERTEIMLSK